MKRLYLFLCGAGLLIALVSIQVLPGYAQATSTPTPVTPILPLPYGWGPAGQIVIENYSGNVSLELAPQLLCDGGIQMERYSHVWPEPPYGFDDPTAIMDVRVYESYSDAGSHWPARIRFGYWSNPDWNHPNYPYGVCIDLQTLTPDYNVIETQTHCICSPLGQISAPGECSTPVPFHPDEPYDHAEYWKFDVIMEMADHGVVRITDHTLQYSDWLGSSPRGVIISGFYVDHAGHTLPDFCGQLSATPTPWLTWTPQPTWTATPTGTLTATPTPLPTSAGLTATPTPTPVPYVTWTPTVSPTPWQSPAPTLFSTPTPADILPTWPAWPTVAWPVVSSVTPYPTRIWDDLTTTPVATATPFTPTVDYDTIISNTLDLTDDINFPQVFQASQSLINTISYPIRVIRGTVHTYMPGLAFLVDALITMLFLVAAVYAIKVILAAVGAVVKLIEVIMEFIPL